MVWSTAQSALYKAVDDYNSRGINVKNYRENTSENCAEKCNNFREKMPEKSRENCSKNPCDFDANSDEFSHENCSKNPSNFDDNSDEFSRENRSKNPCNYHEKACEKSCKNLGYFHCENGKKCGKTSETAEKNGCKRLQNDANFTAKDCKNGIFASFASQPFADKDFIILAGLIFILMSEKADTKLILALVFVLLG